MSAVGLKGPLGRHDVVIRAPVSVSRKGGETQEGRCADPGGEAESWNKTRV